MKNGDVIALAIRENFLLLTSDKDFGEITFRKGMWGQGVVLLRLFGLSPEKKAEIVAKAFESYHQRFEGNFSIITPSSIRIRKPPI